jgi:hypothetical protein
MKVRKRHGASRQLFSRHLVLESLEIRRVFAADMVCLPGDSWKLGELAAQGNDAIVGPALDSMQLRHRELPNAIRLDSQGHAYSYLPAIQEDGVESGLLLEGGEGNSAGGGFSGAGLSVPIYHSKPNASKKIYLDFDGELVSGTLWNNQNYTGSYNTGAVINAPPYSIDSDRSTFNAQELTTIREIWARMAEDFAPFQVDVTTEFPGDAIFRQGNQAIRVMISTDTDATTNTQWFPNAGGVAYLNSWTFTNGSPVWVFYNRLGTSNAKSIAEAGSHEVGHAFNLQHDGRSSPSETYYAGHGSGQTGWAPIMGVGYNRALVQWSKGEYPNANQTQDDLAIISGKVPYEPDDHGNSSATATILTSNATGGIQGSGLITTRTDVDAFGFFTQTGQVSLNADPFELSSGKANLDIQLTLIDSAGASVAVVNPVASLNATLTTTLAKGFYTAIIDGVGKGANGGDFGYTDYGSLGWYTLSGTVVPNSNPVVGTTESFVVAYEGELLTNSGTWSDPNLSDIVTLTASSGTLEQSPDGTWNWFLPTTDQFTDLVVTITATDDLGGVGITTFTASAENRAPELTITQTSLSGNVLSAFFNSGSWSDVSADTVVLVASMGVVSQSGDGTWTWSLVPTQVYSSETVTITATDEDGGSSQVQFTIDALVAVVNSKVYYKGSSFAGTSVNAALDSSKVIARSGADPLTLTYANLINTSRGINGLVFDIAGLAATGLTSADFVFRMSPTGSYDEASHPPSGWIAAPDPIVIDVTPGTSSTPARVRLEWHDNAISNRWLQAKILANANTGLASPAVHYLGHLFGEVNGATSGGSFSVSISDVTAIRSNVGFAAPVTSPFDLDKNGTVSTGDITSMRPQVGLRSLRAITIPRSGSDEEGEGGGHRPLLALGPSSSIGPRWTGGSHDVPLPQMSGGDLLSLDAYFERLAKGLLST